MAYRQNDSQRRNDQFHFDLMEHIGVLSMRDTGWTREVNIVSWNGGRAKLDIREWDPQHKRMTKGVALFEEEAEALANMLAKRYGLMFADKEPAHRTFMTKEAANRSFMKEEPPSAEAQDKMFGEEDEAMTDAGELYMESQESRTGASLYEEVPADPGAAPYIAPDAAVPDMAPACVAETAAQMNENKQAEPVPVSEVVAACVAETSACMAEASAEPAMA